MPQIDLSILNQRQTPAFYADVLANRPAAGFIGRIFVSTNTYEFYRDNGTSWDIIGGPGAGTVTGGGSLYRVAIWNSTSSIGESNNLIFDFSTNRLGIGTNAPGAALDVHSAANSIAQFNQTTATNNSLLVLQNSGSALWRLGNYYNAGANDFGVFDVIGAQQPLTIKKTTGQVLIGTSTVGSGKLVVASATGDNGVQIVGASAPSLRIDNAESGPTKRAGLGISTAVNNFIQGSVDGDICFFSGSTTPSPILFGIYATTNVQEAARISAARNFLVGTVTDAGQKFQVVGTTRLANNVTFGEEIFGPNNFYINGPSGGSGTIHLRPATLNFPGGTVTAGGGMTVSNGFTVSGSNNQAINITSTVGGVTALNLNRAGSAANWQIENFRITSGALEFKKDATGGAALMLFSTYNVGINTTTDAGFRLDVNGTIRSTGIIYGGSFTPGAGLAANDFFATTGRVRAGSGISFRGPENGDNINIGFVPAGVDGINVFVTNTNIIQFNGGGANTATMLNITPNFNPSSGTANKSIFTITGQYNTSGTYSGGITGFLYNPALTSLTGVAFHRAIETVTGNVCFGTSSGNVLIGTATSGASKLRIVGLPTSAAGLSSGDVYSNLGVLTIVP
jgi:hypothetical protein